MKAQIPAPILTKQELETPRTAAEMLTWVDRAAARFDTKQLKAEAREGKHFAKELLSEARPMALFALRYYDSSSSVTVQHVIGDQNYDGIVTDNRPNPATLRYLEVTTTLVTYDDSLRMELLNTQGHAPAFGPIVPIGPKHKRVAIHAPNEAYEHTTIRKHHINLVIDAVTRKAGKAYEPRTALIVAIDDYLAFRDEDDVAELHQTVCTRLVPMLRVTNFTLLALEGSRAIHLTYEL